MFGAWSSKRANWGLARATANPRHSRFFGFGPNESGRDGRDGRTPTHAPAPGRRLSRRVDFRRANRLSDLLTAHPGVGLRNERGTSVAADKDAEPAGPQPRREPWEWRRTARRQRSGGQPRRDRRRGSRPGRLEPSGSERDQGVAFCLQLTCVGRGGLE